MNPSLHPTPELRDLVDQCLDGTLDDLSRFRLERLLREEPASLAYYMELAGNEALLAARLGTTATLPSAVHADRKRRVWLPIAAAVAMLGAAGFLIAPHVMRHEVAGPAVLNQEVPVRITGLVGVHTDGSDRLRLTERPEDKRLVFDAGLIELTFDQGAVVLLEGPADLEVTGPNSCKVSKGRLVANIPLQARGFSVNYREGQLIDHGTEFALDVDETGSATEIGVFRGEVELFESPARGGLKLFTDYAVKRTDDGLRSSTFDRDRFVREIPSREFSWDMRPTPLGERREFLYNISPLMHGGGEFRVIFRRLQGWDEIAIELVEIRRNGKVVAHSDAVGHTGDTHLPGRFNDYRLTVPPSAWGEGRWELMFRAKSPVKGPKRNSSSRGVVCFEEGLSMEAQPENFVGLWAYSHGDSTYVRDIRKDGTARLYIDGKLKDKSLFDGRWTVSDNVMEMRFANGNPPETHYLRDISTMIFLSRNYRNAHRIEKIGD